jgi:hypothetical protein
MIMYFFRNHKRFLLLASIAAAVVLIAVAPVFGAPWSKKYVITETELQSEMMAFADRLASYLHQALRDYEQKMESLKLRTVVQKDVVLTSVSAITISADPNPGTALLDMVAMVTMGRLIYEGVWVQRHGDQFLPMVNALVKGEREIWDLAAKLLDEAQQRTLRELIEQWRTDHPEHTGFAYLRFGYMASDGAASPSVKQKAGGLFKSVKEATKQVEEARLLAERTTYLATRIPLLLGGLGDFWMGDLVKNKDIQTLLADIHQIAITVHQLPEKLSQERTEAISQSMQEVSTWSRSAIDRTMRNISAEREQTIKQFFDELSKERQNALKEMLAEETTYSKLLAELRKTIEEGNQLLVSAGELAKMLPAPSENEVETAPAMDLNDYRVLLADVQITIRELKSLLDSLEKAADSPALEKINQLIESSMDKAGKEGEELIDLSFKRGVLLTLLAVVALLLAQVLFIYVKKRLVT